MFCQCFLVIESAFRYIVLFGNCIDPIYTLIYITIKCPKNFANIDWFVDFLFCHKIKYVNLGLLIWLVYFDIVDTLLQFIERNSDSVSRSMLLII